jgi:dihydrofolate reductase
MKLIVAINDLSYIGKDGKMLWKSPEDFKHFKSTTMGGTLIVGRLTYEICMGGRDLPGRDTVVVGTDYNSLYQALIKALKYSNSKANPDIWVIGGAEIYEALIHLCDEIHLSHIDNSEVGDRKFIIPANYRGKVIDYYFQTP